MSEPARPLRVAFVCQWFAPEPVSQPGWLVDGLRRQGADVEVLTGVPNYPTGEVFAPYRAWRGGVEVREGVKITRAPLFPSHDARPFRRIANYVSWALSAAAWGRRTFARADVALVYSSPATAAFPAMVARWRWGIPYVLLIQDVWPDSVLASGMVGGRVGAVVRAIVDVFVRYTYRFAAHVVVISPGMKKLLVSRGVPAHKVSVVFNWIGGDPTDLRDADRPTTDGGKRTLMYAGNLGAAQDLGPVLDAVAATPGIHLLLVGDGAWREQLEQHAARLGTDRIRFLGPRPRSEMSALMASADVQLVSLRDDPLFSVTIPSKLQSVLAAGHPVLMRGEGDAADVVHENDAGWVVHPADDAAFCRTLRDIADVDGHVLEAMGRRGAVAYESVMSEDVGAPRLMAELEAAAVVGEERKRGPE